MPHVTTLVPGNELHGSMKIGWALTVSRDVHGYITLVVPTRPQAARAADISSFLGFVLHNDTVGKVLTLQVSSKGPTGKLAGERDYVSLIPYWALLRLRVMSSHARAP